MSRINTVLSWLLAIAVYATSSYAFAECQHASIYLYKFQLALNSASYNKASNSITFNLQAIYTGRSTKGTTCTGGGPAPTINTAINVDGRVGTYTAQATSGFSYTITVPGRTANSVVLSGSSSYGTCCHGASITGASYSNPFVSGLNEAPSVPNISRTIAEDTALPITLTASDPDAGDTHYFQIISGSPYGTEVISGSNFAFTPNANWSGTTTVTYRAVDSFGDASNIGVITITVTPVNDAPTAVANIINTAEDTSVSAALGVIDPDIPYGDRHIFEITSQPSFGVASISGETLSYDPPENWYGTTSLTYRVMDTAGVWSSPATITINVAAINDAPVAEPKTLTLLEDTPGTVTLTATDIDSPTPIVFQIYSSPENGSASINGSVLSYTPPINWNGTTTLTYRAQDSSGSWSNPANISISVTPVNDVPQISAYPLVIKTLESKPASIKYIITK